MIETFVSSSILIIILCIIRFLLKGKINFRLQYALWGLAAIRLLLPNTLIQLPGIGSSFSIMNPVVHVNKNVIKGTDLEPLVTNITTGVVYHDENATSLLIKLAAIDWELIIMAVWFAGVVIIGIWMIVINIRFSRYLIDHRKRILKPDFPLPVYTVSDLQTPCLYGVYSEPAVYITPEILENPEQLEHVLTHELCHFKHYDHMWSIIRCGLIVLYWVNPFVWLAAYLSKRDCELACDEAAIEILGNEQRIQYGRTILSLVTNKATSSDLIKTAITMTADKRALKERIKMIADQPKMLKTTLAGLMLVLLAVIAVTFTSSEEEFIDLRNNSETQNISDSMTKAEEENSIKDIRELIPRPANWNPDLNIGADSPVLDYASRAYIIFHGYFGLFVYDLDTQTLVRTLDLESIGCNMTQGDNYCEVTVSKDGKTVYLHPLSEETMYVYKVEDNKLYQQQYEKTEEPFNNFVPIEELVKESGFYSYNAVRFITEDGYEYFGYLYFMDSNLNSLVYQEGDMLMEIFREK
ncbi:beta-lactamase regulating signal transducer with metallopeptidase domain [Mobilisporobacter senegalensis]|uniref:Beta-lactamase regulating signal transducer with metallopeptidase domain n=1 Tax=Mobilisporobacter senegalensis TaxID=1329262 RepID=A0A3N1XTS0_9FIRM|nr:M56 family metallopeptidase [Mobilisporobacter senegalensis]ROR28267.1 beta-lactamase regulating signal transducer with metallopeptidase domain [Mobilisporobacter senegalensis]